MTSTFCCDICANDYVNFLSVGPCDHSICSLCSLRLRVKFKPSDKCCPLCKQVIEFAIIYDIRTTKTLRDYYSFGIYDDTPQNGVKIDEVAKMIYVDCDEHYKDMEALRSYVCPHRGCIKNGKYLQRFPCEKDLLDHILSAHQLLVCYLCLEHRPLFISEHRLMSAVQLKKHMTAPVGALVGAKGDKSAGHPACQFCNEHFYDAQNLYLHMRKAHYTCHLCPSNYQHRYYKEIKNLWDHFNSSHFTCHICHPTTDKVYEEAFVYNNKSEYIQHLHDYHNIRKAGPIYLGFQGSNVERVTFIDLDMSSADPNRLSNQNNSNGSINSMSMDYSNNSSSSSSSNRITANSHYNKVIDEGNTNDNNIFSSIPANMRVAGRVTGSGRFFRDHNEDLLQAAVDEAAINNSSRLPASNALSSKNVQDRSQFPDLKGSRTAVSSVKKEELHPLSLIKIIKSKQAANETARRSVDDEIQRTNAAEERKRDRNNIIAAALGLTSSHKESNTSDSNSSSGISWTGETDVLISQDVISHFAVELRHTLFPPNLIAWARASKKDLLKLEKKMHEFMLDKSITSINLKPMDSLTRGYIICLSKHYQLNSFEYDYEPKRYVSLVKTIDSAIPLIRLSSALSMPSFEMTPEVCKKQLPVIYFIAKMHLLAYKTSTHLLKVDTQYQCISTVANLIRRLQHAVKDAGIDILAPRVSSIGLVGPSGVALEFLTFIEASNFYYFIMTSASTKVSIIEYFHVESGFIIELPIIDALASASTHSNQDRNVELSVEYNDSISGSRSSYDDKPLAISKDDFVMAKSKPNKPSMYSRNSSKTSATASSSDDTKLNYAKDDDKIYRYKVANKKVSSVFEFLESSDDDDDDDDDDDGDNNYKSKKEDTIMKDDGTTLINNSNLNDKIPLTWTCSTCTYINDSSHNDSLVCQMCYSDKETEHTDGW